MSKFTVSGSTIPVDTVELIDNSIEELEDDIVSYTNKGNEVSIDSPVNFVGLFDCSAEPSSIVAEDKARNEATAIKIWGSEVIKHIIEEHMQICPNKVEYSSIPPEITIVGSPEISRDKEIWICDMGASNHSTISKGTSKKEKNQSQTSTSRILFVIVWDINLSELL